MRLRFNRIGGLKILLVIVAIVLFSFATFTLIQQQRQSQLAVAGHTQVLNQINNVVTELEKNNQTNHDTTIKYLQCIVEGLINSTPQTAQASFNACLAVSGIQQ